MKQFKIKIYDENHSEAVQKILFKLGYRWSNSGSNVNNLQAKYLFGYDDYEITHSSEESQFINNKSVIATIDDLYGFYKDFNNEVVQLNDNHSCVISKSNVRVGCQTFGTLKMKGFVDKFCKAHDYIPNNNNANIDDDEAGKIGKAIINTFYLKPSECSANALYDTNIGNKTHVGIGRMVVRIINDSKCYG